MTASRALAGTSALALTALLLAGCGVTAGKSAGEETTSGPITDLQVLVPNSPGSGYDVTGRAVVKTLQDLDLASGTEVTNLPGASGTVGLARTIQEADNGNFLMVMGLGVVGAAYTNQTEAKIADTTPVARLIEEAGAIFVPAASPYQSIDDLIEAWKSDPASIAVGGGSSAGGPDHLLPMQLADAVGISPKEVNFISYDGAGELLPAVLGGKVAFAASGYGEFLEQVESGDLRMLAVTSEEPIEGIDAPTLKDSGIDLVFTNWRGLVAPPKAAKKDVDALVAALTRMHDSEEWQSVLESNGWTDAFLTGDQFGEYIAEQNDRVATVLEDLGLS